jgi:FkbM family methyltransferase
VNSGAIDYDPFGWFKAAFSFRTLIDIGAADGEYGAFIVQHQRIRYAYFFEPRKDCQVQLGVVAAKVEHGAVFPVALGDKDGNVKFIETAYGPSSSILPAMPHALGGFPQIQPKAELVVPLRKLDNVLAERHIEDDLLIKVDVQGFEDRVIRGGARTFRRAKAVLIEMSFVPLYQGQLLFEEVHQSLVQAGLRFAGIKNQVVSPDTERPVFAHCVYIRERTDR